MTQLLALSIWLQKALHSAVPITHLSGGPPPEPPEPPEPLVEPLEPPAARWKSFPRTCAHATSAKPARGSAARSDRRSIRTLPGRRRCPARSPARSTPPACPSPACP